MEKRLESVIENVGQHLHQRVDDDRRLSPLLKRWKQTHGLQKANNPDLILTKQATLDLLCQLTLYSSYRVEGVDLPPLDASHVQDQLRKAWHQTHNPGFTESSLNSVFSEYATSALVQELLEARHLLANATNPTVTIGQVFESLISKESRRTLGQYRTPHTVAQSMCRWAVTDADDIILDAGVGTGILSAEAYRAKNRLRGSSALSEIVGIDKSPLAVTMAATGLTLAFNEKPHLFNGDLLEIWATTAPIQSTEGPMLPPVNAIVANPPYTRYQDIPKEARKQLQDRIGFEANATISGQSPLHLYCIIHAAQILSAGGRMAILMPTTSLDAEYGSPLKQFLQKEFNLHAFIRQNRESPLFREATTTACLMLLEKSDSDDQFNTTTFIQTSDWPSDIPLQTALTQHQSCEPVEEVQSVTQSNLDPDTQWTSHFEPDSNKPVMPTDHRLTCPLENIAAVKRGINTGAVNFFCFSRDDLEAHDFPPTADYLAPLLRRPGIHPHFTCSLSDWIHIARNQKQAWLLDLTDHGTEINDSCLEKYLEQGRQSNVTDRYVVQNRSPWYAIEQRDPAPILAVPATSSRFRFIANTTDLQSVNSFYNVYPYADYSESQMKALMACLNSNLVNSYLKKQARHEAKGMDRLNVTDLKGLPVPDPCLLSARQILPLAGLFDSLDAASRGDHQDTSLILTTIDEYLERLLREEEISDNLPSQYETPSD